MFLLFIYFIHGSLYLLIPYPFHAPPFSISPLVSTSLLSIPVSLCPFCCIQSFYFFRFHICDIILYLSFSFWLISLSVILSRSNHVVANGKLSFLWRSNIPLSEKAMAPHSSTLAWKISWTEEPGRLQSMGPLRVRHDWATSLSLFTFMHWRRKWQPTPVYNIPFYKYIYIYSYVYHVVFIHSSADGHLGCFQFGPL